MRLPIVTRRRHERELARQRRGYELAIKKVSTEGNGRWKGIATRTAELYTDTSIVNDCLTRDLTKARRRTAIARKAAARILAAYFAEKKRADRLQRRLDGMCGLNDPAVLDGIHWQKRRQDKATPSEVTS